MSWGGKKSTREEAPSKKKPSVPKKQGNGEVRTVPTGRGSLSVFRNIKDARKKMRLRRKPSMAIYGFPGTGKTHFFTTFPGIKFYIGTENGLIPILSDEQLDNGDYFIVELLEEGFDGRNIMVRNKDGTIQVDAVAVIDRFYDVVYEVAEFVKNNPDQEVSVCIDDWGTVWDIAKMWRTQRYISYAKSDDARNKMELGIGTDNLGGWDNAISWDTTVNKILVPLNYLRSLNVNLLLTGKMKEIKRGESVEYIPDWYKKTEGIVDIVMKAGYTGRGFNVTIMKARKPGEDGRKANRFSPIIVDSPTYDNVMKAIFG